ncbi:MAG: DMT family transporter [Gammaproteobacteria bacterium]
MNPQALAYLQIVCGAVLLSSGSAAIKATQFDAFQLAGVRAVVIVAFMTLAVRPALRLFDRTLLPAAVAHAATTILFMLGNKLTTAATAIFLQYTAPLYLLLLGPWLLKEPVARRDVAYVGLLLVGMVMLLLNPPARAATASNPVLGGIVAACCGVTWAFTTLTMRGLARDPQAGFQRTIASIIVANVALAVVLLPLFPPGADARALDFGLAAYMGVLQLGTAFILVTLGLRRVTALEGALLLLIEPVLNPIWVYFVHGETLGAWGLAGGALILAATGTRAVVNARRLKRTGI